MAAEQSRLAAAGRSEEAGDLSGFEAKIHTIDNGVLAVALDNVIEFKLSHSA